VPVWINRGVGTCLQVGEQDQKGGAKNRNFKETPKFLSNFVKISAKVEGQLPPLPPVSNNPDKHAFLWQKWRKCW